MSLLRDILNLSSTYNTQTDCYVITFESPLPDEELRHSSTTLGQIQTITYTAEYFKAVVANNPEFKFLNYVDEIGIGGIKGKTWHCFICSKVISNISRGQQIFYPDVRTLSSFKMLSVIVDHYTNTHEEVYALYCLKGGDNDEVKAI